MLPIFSLVTQASRPCSPKGRSRINTKNILALTPPSRYIGRMAIKDQTSLIRDLLDPDLDTPEIARRHHAEPEDLRAAVRSPAFQTAAAAIREVDEARTAALLPVQQARAMHRLARIAAQPAETTAQSESARRAATALIRAGRSALRADSSDSSASGADAARPRKDDADFSTPPAVAGRRASDASARPSSADVARPNAPSPPSSRHPTHGAALTIGDILSVLASSDPQIGRNTGRAARGAKPTTAAELLARLNTG